VRVIGGETVLSPSDLVSFAACGHLAQLERAAAANLVQKPIFADPAFDLLLQRGKEHEERYLAELEAAALGGSDEGSARRLTRIAVDRELGLPGVEAAARETEAAMRRGDAVIYQATFLQPDGDVTWRGHADFLVRVDAPASRAARGSCHAPASASDGAAASSRERRVASIHRFEATRNSQARGFGGASPIRPSVTNARAIASCARSSASHGLRVK
jgi:hypothetical protein